MVKKLLMIMFLSTSINADILILKCGSNGLGTDNLTTQYRSNQVIDIVGDGIPLSDHMRTHFRCAKVNKIYTSAERNELCSRVYDWSILTDGIPKLVAKRKYYVMPENIPTIAELKPDEKEKAIEEWYKKDKPQPIIDLKAYDVRDFVSQKSTNTPIAVSPYDKGGSISSGTYTIGTGYEYSSLTTFQADMAFTLTGAVTGQLMTGDNPPANGVYFDYSVTTPSNDITIFADSSVRHAGKWDGTKSSVTATITDGYSGVINMYSNYPNNLRLVGFQIKAITPIATGRCFYAFGAKSKPSTFELINCIFWGGNNTVRISNGADDMTCKFDNCIFSSNTSNSLSSGVYMHSERSTFTITNCISMGGKNGFYSATGTQKIICYNCYASTNAGICYTPPTAIQTFNYCVACDTTGSAGFTPTQPQNCFKNITMSGTVYSLDCTPLATSPLINAGTPVSLNYDIAGQKRPIDSYDIGVFEWQISNYIRRRRNITNEL